MLSIARCVSCAAVLVVVLGASMRAQSLSELNAAYADHEKSDLSLVLGSARFPELRSGEDGSLAGEIVSAASKNQAPPITNVQMAAAYNLWVDSIGAPQECKVNPVDITFQRTMLLHFAPNIITRGKNAVVSKNLTRLEALYLLQRWMGSGNCSHRTANDIELGVYNYSTSDNQRSQIYLSKVEAYYSNTTTTNRVASLRAILQSALIL